MISSSSLNSLRSLNADCVPGTVKCKCVCVFERERDWERWTHCNPQQPSEVGGYYPYIWETAEARRSKVTCPSQLTQT